MKQYDIHCLEGKMILLGTILASGMAFLDGSVVNIAIPTLQEKLHASLTQIQWVINGYALTLCALILVSGALGDKFGRKKIFLYGISLFVISSFLCSISQSIEQLAIFRAIQGIGGAMMVPGSLSIIHTSFKESMQGRAIGIWTGFAGGVATLGGPLLGGFLVQIFGWPAIFYINIPLGIIAILVGLKFIPESKDTHAGKIDVISSLLIFLSLALLTYGFIAAPDKGWGNPLTITSLFLGALFFLLFGIYEKRSKNPLVPLKIFQSPLVTGSNIVTFFLYGALSVLLLFLVLNFQQIQHYSPIQTGFGMLPPVILITFLAAFGGYLADKIGPRIPMIAGPLLVSFGMTLLVFTGNQANYLLQFLPALVLFGLGMAITVAPLTKAALSTSTEFSGVASGVNNAVSRIAGLLAVAILGALVLMIFKQTLIHQPEFSLLKNSQQQQILSQVNNLGNIEIPKEFNYQEKIVAQNAIENSFLYAFKWAMGINAALALISALVSFFTIHNSKQSH